MNTTKLEIIFNLVLQGAYKLQKNSKNADGLKFWHPIKKELSQYDEVKPAKWKKISKRTTKKYMSIDEYTIDGYGKQQIIEIHHFLIQQVRIPNKEKASIRKIVQLGLNIGQFKGKTSASFRQKLHYNKTNLDKLSTYVSKKDLQRLSKYISDETIERIHKI